MKSKKGQVLSQLGSLGIGVVTLTVVLAVVFLMIVQTKTQMRDIQSRPSMEALNGTIAFNSTITLEGAVATIPGWVPLIILVAIGSIILGLVAVFGKR